jgi:hypothetical protein
MMRFLLVEAAQVTVRSLPEWRSKYLHLMMRRGRKTAKVARNRVSHAAKLRKSRACFGEAQSAVRSTAYFIRIMFTLTVIFPEADKTDFVVPSTVQGLQPAAWASI